MFNISRKLKKPTIAATTISSVYWRGYALFLALFITLSPLNINAYSAPSDIVLSTFTMFPPLSNATDTGIVDLVIKEAFLRIGISVSIENLPAERSLISANQGITDGEFIRIAGLDKIYPNLIQVPEKIIDFEFVAFSKRIDIRTANWESLKPYNVAIVTGWKILENNIAQTAHRTDVEDAHQLFTLLSLDRVDIVVFEKLVGIEMAKSHSMQGVKVLGPPLAKKEMFLYLHKKHKDLVSVVASSLREMKNDGTYEKIISEGLASNQP